MTFRASSQIKANALAEIKQGAIRAKALAQQARTTLAAGDTSAQTILNWLQLIKTLIDRWAVLSATPGLAAYASDQEDDLAYDVSVEFSQMRNALVAVRDRIINDLPKATAPAGVVGMLAVYALTPTGDLVSSIFTPAQTATLRADLDVFVASVA